LAVADDQAPFVAECALDARFEVVVSTHSESVNSTKVSMTCGMTLS